MMLTRQMTRATRRALTENQASSSAAPTPNTGAGDAPQRTKRRRQIATDEQQEKELAQSVSRRRLRKPQREFPSPEKVCFSSSSVGSKIRICTSGYSYQHWHEAGSFYEELPKNTEVEFKKYASEYDTVELNGTFYGWFTPATFEKWKARASAARPTFEYVVKASKLYTHKKRLNVDDYFKQSWKRFYDERCLLLGSHLGPMLFQFPSDFKRKGIRGRGAAAEPYDNLDRLRALGEVLPREGRFVFEFRDKSWLTPEVYDVMRQHDWCLALVDVTGARNENKETTGDDWAGNLSFGANPTPQKYPLDICSWGAYIRFHGSQGKYAGSYGRTVMAKWAQQIKLWADSGRKVYAAFNNDCLEDGGMPSAVADSRDLADALREIGAMT